MKPIRLMQRVASLSVSGGGLPLHRIGASDVCRGWIKNFSSEATASDHSVFLKEVAALEPPASLQALLNVLQAKGESVVSPYQRKGIIPLAVPLTVSQDGDMTALLRWPTPGSSVNVPVVRVQRHGILLLAKSPEEYIHRALVEEDVAESSGRISESAGSVGRSLYRLGEFKASKMSSMDAYLMKNVGHFPDIFERLALRHLEKGDNISALVTGEYYASKRHFPGFGRPYVFNAELMLKVGRKKEARDAARCALRSPWWTLGSSYADVARIANCGESQIKLMRERASDEGRQEDLLKGKSLEQVAVDQAGVLLDLAAVECTWDDVREQLASHYKEGGLEDISRFVSTA